jgi:hypothetical protein
MNARVGSALALALAAPLSPLAWADPEVPALTPRLLRAVEDGKPVATYDRNEAEAEAWSEAVARAHAAGRAALAAKARRDVTYGQAWQEPAKYRGDVIHLEGRLVEVREVPLPANVRAAGVDRLYEGWVFDRDFRDNPWCVVFSELPAAVKPGQGLDEAVSFDGYFFKRYRYEARDSRKPGEAREVPLVIGAALTFTAPPRADAGGLPHTYELLPLWLVLIGSLVALAVGLTWWFRRGDRLVRARLGERTAEFIQPPQDDTV